MLAYDAAMPRQRMFDFSCCWFRYFSAAAVAAIYGHIRVIYAVHHYVCALRLSRIFDALMLPLMRHAAMIYFITMPFMLPLADFSRYYTMLSRRCRRHYADMIDTPADYAAAPLRCYATVIDCRYFRFMHYDATPCRTYAAAYAFLRRYFATHETPRYD